MKKRAWNILSILLIGFIGLTGVSQLAAQSVLNGDKYGSIRFEELGLLKPAITTQEEVGKLTISGVTVDFTAEVKAVPEGFLYFPKTVSSTAAIGPKNIIITHEAGDKYQKILEEIVKQWDSNFNLEKLISLLDQSKIQRKSWRYHFFGYYYHRKAREKLKEMVGSEKEDLSFSTIGRDKKEELFFPAIEKYKVAIREDPAFPMPHLNLAYIYVALGDKKSALDKCKLAAKSNWYDVPFVGGEHTDTFGIILAIEDLISKVGETTGAQFRSSYTQFDSTHYDRKLRQIPREINDKIKSDEDAQNMEVFVESMQKYLPYDEKARLYHNLGYYYHTKGAYSLALMNYKKAFETYLSLGESALEDEIPEIIYNNIKATYEKLDWFEAEEVALMKKNPFKKFPF